MSKSLPAILSVLVLACGGAPEPAPASTEASTGGELAPPAPSGPSPSYLPEGHSVQMRIDVARVRRSPIAPDIASAIRSTRTWQALAGSSGADPIQDFDAILVGADALYTNRRVVVLRTPHDEATVRDRVLRMAEGRGAPQAWREVEGLPTIGWPMPRIDVAYSIAITAPHELVLVPDDELPRIAAIARDHAARRAHGETGELEPHLVFRPAEVSTLRIDVALPRYAGYPDPPDRLRAEIDQREADGAAAIAIHGEFADEPRAAAARAWIEQQSEHYAQQTMVRVIGMNRPLEDMTIAQTGSSLDLATWLTTEEIRRVLGLVALSQLGERPSEE